MGNLSLKFIEEIKEIFLKTEITDKKGKKISFEEALKKIKVLIEKIKKEKKAIIFIGNGGSASVSSHKSLDFWRNLKVKTMFFSDYSRLTCLSNDEGYEKVYSLQLKDYSQKGDVLIAISSSGKSKNILKAVEEMKKKDNKIITFSGFSPLNPLRKRGDFNFYVPSFHYNKVESIHLLLCDLILEYLENGL